MQIQKTQAANIRLQQEHLRDQLRVRIYEDASAIFEEAARLAGRRNTDTVAIVSSLRMELDGHPTSSTTTAQQVSDLHFEASRALSGVLLKLEQYEIAFAPFRTIRREISEVHSRFLKSHVSLFSKLSLLLLNTHPDTGEPLPRLADLTEERVSEADKLQRAYGHVCSEIQSYIMDLQIESQNELLGHLFGRQLPARNPLDPEAKVLTRDSDEAIERPPGSVV